MRVVHLMAGGGDGGAETYFTETVCALAAAGLEQHVVTRPHPRVDVLRAAGVAVTPSRFGVLAGPGIARVVRGLDPAVTQAWMGRAASLMPRRAGTVGWFGGYYDLRRYRRCEWLVGCTEDIARHIRASGRGPERVRTIHTFAELDGAPAVPRDLPNGARLLLFLGRLHPKKGVDTLLAALAALPDCHLWIAGDGPERAGLEGLAARLGVAGRVRFLGWRTDRAALLRAADALVVPSRYEPFGTVMVEAWATGTPLIAAAAAGPSAYVEPGRNGLLVPIDDAPALAAAVRRVLSEPGLRARLVAGGTATVEARFTRPRIVSDWLALYREVAAARPAG